MNYIFLFIILLSMISASNTASASLKECTDFFSATKSEIVQFPVPPGEVQVRDLGKSYFALISGTPPLQEGGIFEVRSKKDIRIPEKGSRLLLLKTFGYDQTSNFQRGRWIVVKDNQRNFLQAEVYTSKAELQEIITTVILGETNKQQFDQTDLRVLTIALQSSLRVHKSIAEEIAVEYGKLPNSINIFTLRQFPRVIKETLKKHGLTLVFLDENGNPT